MHKLLVSFAVKRGIFTILVTENGMLKKRVTEKFKDKSIADSTHRSTIHAFIMALRTVKNVMASESGDYSICFETSNSIFVKWVDNQYAKDGYVEEFNEALNLLHELPILYNFTYNTKPMAVRYCGESYITKVAVSGLDSLEG